MYRSVLFLTALMLVSACGGEPRDYTESDRIKDGPGLLTGERGAIVIAPSGIEN